MSTWLLLFIYSTLILLISLAGGLVPLKLHMTHLRMQLTLSLVAGVMLGVGLLHMLPHALLEAPGQTNVIFMLVLAGIITMFFLERFFCFHHHDVPEGTPLNGRGIQGQGVEEHHHDHQHSRLETHDEAREIPEDIPHKDHSLSWVGAVIGLTLHSTIAGIALAASVEAGRQGENMSALAGLGTFLVIFLHKPFDAMTITTLMTVGSRRRSTIHLVNALFALVIPLGVALFYLGLTHFGGDINLVAYALAFSAGTFICISLSDLLPELQFHAHDRVALSTALISGLLISVTVSFFEGGVHGHEGHGHSTALLQQEHESGHNHETDAHGEEDLHKAADAHLPEDHDEHENHDEHEHEKHGAGELDLHQATGEHGPEDYQPEEHENHKHHDDEKDT